MYATMLIRSYFALLSFTAFIYPSHGISKRQVIYLDEDYPKPHDPAAIDPEELREIENSKTFPFGNEISFDHDFFEGAFSENLPKTVIKGEELDHKKEKRSIHKEVEETLLDDWSKKVKNHSKSNDNTPSNKVDDDETISVDDQSISSSRFFPFHGPPIPIYPYIFNRNFRRPRFNPRFYNRKPTHHQGRSFYREPQQSKGPHLGKRQFTFLGSASPKFSAQFSSIANSKNANKNKNSVKAPSNEILGSGNFDILPGGIFQEEDDVNDYGKLRKHQDSNKEETIRNAPSKYFDAARSFLDRFFAGRAFSENHAMVLKNDTQKH